MAMELQELKMVSSQDDNKEEVVLDEEEERLPGFRFHPTDEELVSFYLRRKIEKRPISLQIIKQIDIYKHDPWEFAKGSSVGDKEWYFYCKRGRKYRNSIRPNRVTASGFWKATGIDKPIYSDGHRCVGLKKSLVYYRGSAGKGTKTDWMMHEFRLPTQQQSGSDPRDTLQEAEIWTLCRIFKRNRKYTPDWREVSAKTTALANNNSTMSVKTRSFESISDRECYISFLNPATHLKTIEQQNLASKNMVNLDTTSSTHLTGLRSPPAPPMAQVTRSDTSDFSSPMNPVDGQESPFLAGYCGDWDDLSSVVEFAINKPPFL